MYRRRLLRAAGVAALAGAAGCLDAADGGEQGGGGGTVADEPTATPESSVDLPVPESALTRGAGTDSIPAITDPVFGPDWGGVTVTARNAFGGQYTVEPRLEPGDRVVGVQRDGEARAYPLKLLNYHEVVNDEFGGPLLVTYCPLCASGVTADRLVDGEPTTFGVSGLLWRSALVMYDEATGSLWSQVLGRAIRGPETGTRLSLVPSALTTWREWRDDHDDAVVLRPPPESSTVNGPASFDYSRNPYYGYAESGRIGVDGEEFEGDRLHPKTLVVGVTHGGTARAYPLPVVEEERVVTDEVGGLPVVVAAGPSGTMSAFVRRVDGEVASFAAAPQGDRIRGAGSTWSVGTGRAVDGPHAGTTLERANDRSPMFWFAWLGFNPETELYRGE